MKNGKNHEKMIDIYESDLEDYFKYLLERVNKFLNSQTGYTEKHVTQKGSLSKKAS